MDSLQRVDAFGKMVFSTSQGETIYWTGEKLTQRIAAANPNITAEVYDIHQILELLP